MVRRIYRFHGFCLDPAARELRRGEERIPLPISALDCLAYLVEQRERAVGRDELIAAVWGRAEVSDTLLSQTVVRVRHVLGDTRNDQHTIRTIPRFGYRWVAEVEVSESANGALNGHGDALHTVLPPLPSATETPVAANAASAAPPTVAAVRPNRSRWLVPGTLALLLLATVIWLAADGRRETAGVSRAAFAQPAVDAAVLPVETSAVGDGAWLRLGLMDAIGERLRAAGLSVVPSATIAALMRDRVRDERHVAAAWTATEARYLILPSAVWNGDGWIVRLDLRAVDGNDRTVEAFDADAIAAGRAAGDRLLALLGRHAPVDDEPPSSVVALVHRVRAALLTDDLDGARRLLETAPAEAAGAPELQVQRAAIELASGRPSAAEQRLREVLEGLPDDAPVELRARVFNSLGAVAIRVDRYDAAERAFAEAVSLLDADDAPSIPAMLGRAYMGRAAAEAALGRFAAARADFSRARIALEEAGDALELARVDQNEAVLDSQRGRYVDALPLFRRAEERFERFGAAASQIKVISNQVAAHLALLDAAGAIVASDRGWPLLGRIEDGVTRHVFEYQRARALAAGGRLTEARALFARLAAEASAHEEASLLAQTHLELAEFELAAGRLDRALALAQPAVEALDLGALYARDRARAWLIAVRALRGQGRAAEAEAQIARLNAYAGQQPQTPAPAYAQLAEAEQRWREGRRDAARTLYAAAFEQVGRDAAPVDVAMVARPYGDSLIADGDLDRASVVVGHIARWAEQDFDCALLQARLYRALGRTDAWRKARDAAERLAGERALPD